MYLIRFTLSIVLIFNPSLRSSTFATKTSSSSSNNNNYEGNRNNDRYICSFDSSRFLWMNTYLQTHAAAHIKCVQLFTSVKWYAHTHTHTPHIIYLLLGLPRFHIMRSPVHAFDIIQ